MRSVSIIKLRQSEREMDFGIYSKQNRTEATLISVKINGHICMFSAVFARVYDYSESLLADLNDVDISQ